MLTVTGGAGGAAGIDDVFAVLQAASPIAAGSRMVQRAAVLARPVRAIAKWDTACIIC